MDIKDIRTLIKMVAETDITEFEIESQDERIMIKRGSTTEVVHMQAPQMMSMPQFAPAAGQAQLASAPATASVVVEKGEPVTSPIVGTFYSAPSPESAPYVVVGQVVEKGQVLCIVEAMKLMNEIEAEFRCKIVKISKENAQAVEFGDTLFLVEKA
jgi:acetyl-CoA carboxylase biotin carboxyl carrier protein